ncbi:MAG TPA: PAS domain S-box protein [Gemmatimonadaceae bacterium]|nr:PAS domain S-box protein [Gemmatimonadaceae bacterium]
MSGFTSGPHALSTQVGIMWGYQDSLAAADDAFLEIVGYTREDLDNGTMNWREMTPPEFLHLDNAGIQQAAATGGFTLPYQKEFVRKDGSRVPVLLVCAFVPDRPGHWMGYVVDLSRKPLAGAEPPPPSPIPSIEPVPEEFYRRLVGELVNERTSMIAMLGTSDSPTWAVDRELRLISANPAFQKAQRRVSGRDLAIGESMLGPAFTSEVRDPWIALYKRALTGERVTHFTGWPDGNVVHRHDHVLMPMRDASGTIYGVTVISHDVSERYDVEVALRASETRFRTLASASPHGVFLTDMRGNVEYTNRRMQEIWGQSAEELLGRASLDRVHPEDRKTALPTWEQAVHDARDLYLEFRLLFPDGTIRNVRCWISCLLENGRATGFVGSVEDATEAVALAQRARQRERLESLGTLAGGIAHDFNNMLGIVLGYTDLGLANRELPQSVVRDFEEIRTASQRARDLVRQILIFSRQSEGEHTGVDLAALTRESGRLLRATLPAHIAFTVHAPEHPITVLGNASALQQVIVNLCVNAEHALRSVDAPSITIDLHANTEAAPATATLTVRDSGHGMPASIADRIFEPFYTTKQVGEGTGMGLAVVHGTVLAHDGSIIVDTTPGLGTTFTITLPTIATAPAATPARATAPARGSGRILQVEDEPQLASVIARLLQRAGYDVTTCHNGTDALRTIGESDVHPDVVLSDVSMPGLTGDRLAEELAVRHPDIPVVLMTGYSAHVTPDGPRGVNVLAVLQKPISIDALSAIIARVIR